MATAPSPFISFFMTNSYASHFLSEASTYRWIERTNFVAARLIAPIVISGMTGFTFLELTASAIFLPIRFGACLVTGRNWRLLAESMGDIARNALRIVFLVACVFASVIAPKTIISSFERTHNAVSYPSGPRRFCSHCRSSPPANTQRTAARVATPLREPNFQEDYSEPLREAYQRREAPYRERQEAAYRERPEAPYRDRFTNLERAIEGSYHEVEASMCAEGRSSLQQRLDFFGELGRTADGIRDMRNLLQFINRLRASEHRPELFNLQIEHLLDGLVRFPEFKTAALARIANALEGCIDRTAVDLDNIHVLWMIYCHTHTDQEYINIAVGQRRLGMIDTFAAAQNTTETVEIALYVRLETKDALNLPILVTGMSYEGCGRIAPRRVRELQEQILRDTSSEDARATIASETEFWQKIIQQRYPLYFAFLEDIDTDPREGERDGDYEARLNGIMRQRETDIIAMVRALTIATRDGRALCRDPLVLGAPVPREVNAFVRRILPHRVA